MNFADALRQAAHNAGTSALPPENPANVARARNTPIAQTGSGAKETKAMQGNDRFQPAERPNLEVVQSEEPSENRRSTDDPKAPAPKPEAAPAEKVEYAYDAMTAESVSVPQTPTVPAAPGSVVRLELFLTPEQLNGLFRAVVANQHTVMTLREAASYLRISASSLEQMAQEGEIPAFLIDGKWRFPRNSVDEWLSMQSFRKEMEA